MSFDELTANMNEVILGAMGQSLSFTRAASLDFDETAEAETITAIVQDGVHPEGMPPMAGSVYAQAWLQQTDIDPAPQCGDEIASTDYVYKIVKVEEDAGNGLVLTLRRDRESE
jgi:hypothetical protein